MSAKPTVSEKFMEVADWLEQLAQSLDQRGFHGAALQVSEAMDKVKAAEESCGIAGIADHDFDWKPRPQCLASNPAPEGQRG